MSKREASLPIVVLLNLKGNQIWIIRKSVLFIKRCGILLLHVVYVRERTYKFFKHLIDKSYVHHAVFYAGLLGIYVVVAMSL